MTPRPFRFDANSLLSVRLTCSTSINIFDITHAVQDTTTVRAVCNGPSMSAAQSTEVHDGLLHPHLRHCSQSCPWVGLRRVTQNGPMDNSDCSSPASAVLSAACRQLFVPRHRRSMFGHHRAFSVAGVLAAWNSVPDYRRDPSRSLDSFRRDLKTFFFSFLSFNPAFRGCQNPINGLLLLAHTTHWRLCDYIRNVNLLLVLALAWKTAETRGKVLS